MDVEWAHAVAPGARILLVEARSDKFDDLVAAEDYARTHARTSRTVGAATSSPARPPRTSTSRSRASSIFFSAGDSGLPAQYPSSSPNVIAVGGTTLHFNGAAVRPARQAGPAGAAAAASTRRRRPPRLRSASTGRRDAAASAPPRTCRSSPTLPPACRSTTRTNTRARAAGSSSAAPARRRRWSRRAPRRPAGLLCRHRLRHAARVP